MRLTLHIQRVAQHIRLCVADMKLQVILASFFSIIASPILAQEKSGEEESIGVQEVTVVKSYSPSLSNVSKISANPVVEDSLSNSKRKLQYQIISVPVLSTFSPNKATAVKLQQKKNPAPFNTLLSMGAGNQQQLFFRFFNILTYHKVAINRRHCLPRWI